VLSYDRTKAFVYVKKECGWHMGGAEKQKDFFYTSYTSARCVAGRGKQCKEGNRKPR